MGVRHPNPNFRGVEIHTTWTVVACATNDWRTFLLNIPSFPHVSEFEGHIFFLHLILFSVLSTLCTKMLFVFFRTRYTCIDRLRLKNISLFFYYYWGSLLKIVIPQRLLICVGQRIPISTLVLWQSIALVILNFKADKFWSHVYKSSCKRNYAYFK